MITMTEKKIVKMRCNAKNQTTIDEYFCSKYILDVITFTVFQVVNNINAVILFHVHQVLLLYVLAFAHHFACTCIIIHILSL